ncbi:MAG: SLC13 family permease, partial [Candidatus Electrothrix sp. EH2]|nr:SLC13 family permease [Candidatus Electrothrix sp. EH2]
GYSPESTNIALATAMIFVVTGIDEPEEFFEALGDGMIWLLLAAFIIAAAVKESGLSARFTLAVTRRARSVSHLFYSLTVVMILTALFIPSTSGRAALMIPIFLALSKAIADQRINRALALLFPSVILQSAVGSLIGAGAHLLTADILWRMGGERIGFLRWMILGMPLAAVSSFVTTWLILHLFLRQQERQRPLHLQLIHDVIP